MFSQLSGCSQREGSLHSHKVMERQGIHTTGMHPCYLLFLGDRASEDPDGSCLSCHIRNGAAQTWRLFGTQPKRHLATIKHIPGCAVRSLSDPLFLLQLGAKQQKMGPFDKRSDKPRPKGEG